MSFSRDIKRNHVIEALEYIDKHGVPSKRLAIKNAVIHDGKSYPPKYVISVAQMIVTKRPLWEAEDWYEFSGGDETKTFLRDLGFTVLE
jgi:hypothetical protein